MCKKIISHLLILSILLTGCYSWELVQEPELDSTIKVTTKNEEIELSNWKYDKGYIIGDSKVTLGRRKTVIVLRKINKNDIIRIEEKYVDGLKTTFLSLGIFGVTLWLIAGIAWKTKGFKEY